MESREKHFDNILRELDQNRSQYESSLITLQEEMKTLIDQLFAQIGQDLNIKLNKTDTKIEEFLKEFRKIKQGLDTFKETLRNLV